MMIVVASRRSTVHWASLAFSVVCLTAFAIWLVLQLSRGDLDRGDKLASIISMSVTVVTLPISVVAIVVSVRQAQPATASLSPAARLDAMAEALAISVRAQWKAEEKVRRVHDPFPLPVRWTNAPEHLVDHWAKINGGPDRPEPIILDGHGDDIVDTFNRVPSGRLVVLGRAGAGKTILTSRFALTLLAHRSVPVPVIFQLGSWNPATRSLRDWQTDQLITTYPILAERDGTGATIAAQLLATGRILPVLDGFDEISQGLRVDAINGINADLRRGDRLLMTSRPEEYVTAVRAGDVLSAAAVARLGDLTVDDLADYLPLTLRKVDVHSGRSKWDPVLERMRAGSVLTQVLATPLMVALARAIFSDTNSNPAELIDITSPEDLEERLLAGFVPAVYSGGGDRYGAHDARRWLEFLAGHLRRTGTYDLAWWGLTFAAPRLVVAVGTGLVITTMTWLALGTPAWLGTWPGDSRGQWLVATLGTSLVGFTLGGVVIGRRRGLRRSPARVRLKIRGRLGLVVHDLVRGLHSWGSMAWIGFWLIGGVLFGAGGGAITGSVVGMLVGGGGGLAVGVGTWFVAVTVRALGAPVDPTETVSPQALLRTDRGTGLREGLAFGMAVSTVLWLGMWVCFEPGTGLRFGLVFGHGVWLFTWLVTLVGLAFAWTFSVTVWGPWLFARFWLSLTGRLPWSVMTFLADAHRRGVLRQAGGVYQFRHARLQDYLATAGGYRPGHASTPERPTQEDGTGSAAATASVGGEAAGDTG